MLKLRVPAADFLLSALKAGKEAGFEGAIVLLSRRLNETQEAELRKAWGDLDDITHNDVLVLTTGIKTKGQSNTIPADEMQRAVYSEGVSIAPSYSGKFNQHFETLLKVADHLPELPDSAGVERLIDAQGITDIRRGLEISESDLPVLFILAYRQNIEYLIRLQTPTGTLSPTSIIIEIVKHLEDVPYKHKELFREKENLNARLRARFRNPSYRKRWHIRSLLDGVTRNIEGRKAELEANTRRVRKVLENSSPGIKSLGETFIECLTNNDVAAVNADELISEIHNYLVTSGDLVSLP